jgi:hypothetical protein
MYDGMQLAQADSDDDHAVAVLQHMPNNRHAYGFFPIAPHAELGADYRVLITTRGRRR